MIKFKGNLTSLSMFRPAEKVLLALPADLCLLDVPVC